MTSDSINEAPFLTLFHDLNVVYPAVPVQAGKAVTLGPMTISAWHKQLQRLQLGCQWRRNAINYSREDNPCNPKQATVGKELEWRERWYCDHRGKKRNRKDPSVPPEKQRKSAPSIKVGCKAGFTVKKLKNQNVIYITWDWQHTGHDPLDIKMIEESRLLGTVKQWINDHVQEGRDWSSIHDLLRVDIKTLEQLDSRSMQIPAALRVRRMDIYNVLRKKLVADSRKDPDFFKSMIAWANRINQEGGCTRLHMGVANLKRVDKSGWSFTCVTKWQKTLLRHYAGQIACLDSTQNTCTGVSSEESVYLYTIVLRSHTTGSGTPAAFLLTNTKCHLPIAAFLKDLWAYYNFKPNYMMIDCSDTEVVAIQYSLRHLVKIVYCHWHFLKAIVGASKQKIKPGVQATASEWSKQVQQLRTEAVDRIKMMMRAATQEEYNQRWTEYEAQWQREEAWLSYIKKQWQPKHQRWAQAWRNSPHQGIETNNYIERWHEELKRRHLKTLRKQRADYLVHLLVEKILPCYQLQEKAVELGLQSRWYSQQEEYTRKHAERIPADERPTKVRDTSTGLFEVQSFTNDSIWYSIGLTTIEDMVYSNKCSCKMFQTRQWICKHMWLLSMERAIPPEGTTVPKRPSTKPSFQRDLLPPMEKDTNDGKQEMLEGCTEVVNRLLSIFAKAQEQEGCGDFQIKQLADLQATLTALYHTAQSHFVNELPSKTQCS